MKTAIVYYSMSGNTELAANRIADALGADVIRIEPKKAYPDKGFRKFFWGGKSAVMGDRPALLPYDFDAGKYDRIVFASPIWASTFAPPIRSFIEDNKASFAGKRFAFVACSSGGGAGKAVEKLAAFLGVDSFEATASLIDPKEKKLPENDAAISDFCNTLSGAAK